MITLPYFKLCSNFRQYSHPYEFEIEKWTPSDGLLCSKEPITYLSLQEVPLVHVDQPSQVEELLADLREADEIAIDLEVRKTFHYLPKPF